MRTPIYTSFFLFFILILISCQPKQPAKIDHPALKIVAQNSRQWTGVAVSKEGRMFVNFPYWSDDAPVSVAEIIEGRMVPFPDKTWNRRKNEEAFQAVQSVFVDDRNYLWVLDTNNPKFEGVQPPGPHLYRFSLSDNRLARHYSFTEDVYNKNSYFNDVRIDTKNEKAYISDSGNGALVVLDLKTGDARRLFSEHPSVKAETDYLMCDGYIWKNSVDADGIALTPDGSYLYYIALSGHSLYRIPTAALNNKDLSPEQLHEKVEKVMAVPATDGMLFDDDSNLWMGGLEDNSVNMLGTDGILYKVVQDSAIRWADSFAKDSAGNMYFTTSQIHLPPENRQEYTVVQLDPSKSEKKALNKVLIAITSHGLLGNTGDSTGYYLSEVSHAYYVFKDAGLQVEFTSPEGGESPVDGYNLNDEINRRFVNDPEAQKAINNAIPAADIDPEKYRTIYYAGGHGTMWDFPTDGNLQHISRNIYEQGGIVSAVCHGPAALVELELSNGKYLVEGKTLTAFTNEEERAGQLEEVVPFLLETKLMFQGASFEEAPIYQEKVVVDGRLVTGQNPASAKGAAEEIVSLMLASKLQALQK